MLMKVGLVGANPETRTARENDVISCSVALLVQTEFFQARA